MKAILRASLPLIELPVNALHWSTHRMIFAVHCLFYKHPPRATLWPSAFSSPMAAFYWCHVALQLRCYYLRILSHAFVGISFPQGFIFTKDVFLKSLLLLFDMEGLFVVFSSLSFDYLEWGRLIVCSIFFCALSSMLFRAHFAFYITFHFFRCSTCFFHAYFAWGRAII
jgi:hypothetical protein